MEINRNCSEQTFVSGSGFIPDVLVQLAMRRGFQMSPENVVGRTEVRRRSWPGDVTRTWNYASGKHGWQTVHWFTCIHV